MFRTHPQGPSLVPADPRTMDLAGAERFGEYLWVRRPALLATAHVSSENRAPTYRLFMSTTLRDALDRCVGAFMYPHVFWGPHWRMMFPPPRSIRVSLSQRSRRS